MNRWLFLLLLAWLWQPLSAQRFEIGYMHTIHLGPRSYFEKTWVRQPNSWLGPDDPLFPNTFRVTEIWVEHAYNVHQPMFIAVFPWKTSKDSTWSLEWVNGIFPNSYSELAVFGGVQGVYTFSPRWRIQIQAGIVSNYSRRTAYTLYGTIPGLNASIEYRPLNRWALRLYGNPEMLGLGAHFFLQRQ